MKAGGEGKDRGQDSWMASLNGHEFEQFPGDSEGQGDLACYSPWGHTESDMSEHLNNNSNIYSQLYPNKTGGKKIQKIKTCGSQNTNINFNQQTLVGCPLIFLA